MIVDPPVIRRQPVAGLVVRGRSTELSCEADGNPPITYEWYKVRCVGSHFEHKHVDKMLKLILIAVVVVVVL